MGLRRTSNALTADQKLAVVSLDEVKAQVRLPVSFIKEDALLKGYIETAYDFLSGPDGWLNGYCLLEETFEYEARPERYGRGWTSIEFPLRPCTALTVQYASDATTFTALDTASYRVRAADMGGLAIVPSALPSLYGLYGESSLRLTGTVGLPPNKAAEIPSGIRQTIKMLVAELYANREESTESVTQRVQFGMQKLAGRYRFEPDHS